MTTIDERNCTVCQRRLPDRPPVCDACRTWLAAKLREIPDLLTELLEQEAELLPDGRVRRAVTRTVDDQLVAVPVYDENLPGRPVRDAAGATRPRDPIAAALPVGGLRRANTGQRISGTAEARTPVRLAVVDLTAAARNGIVHDLHGDQTGEVSIATVLDQWVRDWRDLRHAAEHLPQPTVPILTRWLGDRLEWACDHHPAICDFATEIRRLAAVLRGVLGLIGPEAVWKHGMPCRECEMLTLYHRNGSERIECANCPSLLTFDEYERWTGLVAEAERTDRGYRSLTEALRDIEKARRLDDQVHDTP